MNPIEQRAADRDKRIDALFRTRHAKYPTQDHTRWVMLDPAGRWLRAECRDCGTIINFLEDDVGIYTASSGNPSTNP